MKKTGLFFGSFNPIHVGHLIIANYFVENTDLDEVWFVISPHNPLKDKATLLDDRQRYYMVQLAVEDNPRLRASNVEFHLEQPSYTIHTLAVLKEKYPERDFVLLMGTDNLQSLHRWKNYREILSGYSIYAYRRPGFDGGQWKDHQAVQVFQAPLMQLSSSYIREQIRLGHSVEYLLIPPVYAYVSEMNLYK